MGSFAFMCSITPALPKHTRYANVKRLSNIFEGLESLHRTEIFSYRYINMPKSHRKINHALQIAEDETTTYSRTLKSSKSSFSTAYLHALSLKPVKKRTDVLRTHTFAQLQARCCCFLTNLLHYFINCAKDLNSYHFADKYAQLKSTTAAMN